MKKIILNTIGWVGVAFILGAYAGNVFEIITSHSFIYLALNFVGSIFVLIEAFSKKDYQPVFLNIVWALIAIVMIFRLFV